MEQGQDAHFGNRNSSGGSGGSLFLREGTSAQSGNTVPTKSFVASLGQQPVPAEGDKTEPSPRREEIVFRPLDSLQGIDTLAADKDLVLIMLLGQGQEPSQDITKQLKSALDRPLTSTRKIGAFTLGNKTAHYSNLVQHFGVESFPCVVVLGRGCSASPVSGDVFEERLYEAIGSTSKPAPCCPVRNGGSCCLCSRINRLGHLVLQFTHSRGCCGIFGHRRISL